MSESYSPLEIIERLFGSRKRFERFALLYVRDSHAVQDILMECYAYVWEHRAEIDFTGNVEAYMFTMVKHRCLDYLQHMSRRQDVEANLASDAQWELDMSIATLSAFDPHWLYDKEVHARIRRAVYSLPDHTRQIFIMSRHEGLTYREIAARLGESVKTVEAHMSRALKALRADLGDYFPVLVLLLLECANVLSDSGVISEMALR